MSESTDEKYELRFQWDYNGLTHKAIVANGLITLVVYPLDMSAPNVGGWKVQINGARPLQLLPEYHDLDLAKRAAEGRMLVEMEPLIAMFRTGGG